MSCVLYGEIGPPDSFAVGDKCKQGLDPYPECACLESQITSILGTPGLPAADWGLGCYLWYEYDTNDICPAYENGSDFHYTGHCTGFCAFWLGGNPCDPYDGEQSMPVGNFNDDADSLSNTHGQDVLDTYYSDIAPKEGKYEPEMCLVALEAECYSLNTTTPCIVEGCCAPWIIGESYGNSPFTTNSSLKCLSCSHTQTLPKTIFKRIKDPDWEQDPSVPCSPPPPPPPPPAPPPPPPPPPKPPGNCVGGGGGDDDAPTE